MWQVLYAQAIELARQRADEANQERLARLAQAGIGPSSRFDGLRRGGAVIAAGIARRLDECAAREQLEISRSAQLPG